MAYYGVPLPKKSLMMSNMESDSGSSSNSGMTIAMLPPSSLHNHSRGLRTDEFITYGKYENKYISKIAMLYLYSMQGQLSMAQPNRRTDDYIIYTIEYIE